MTVQAPGKVQMVNSHASDHATNVTEFYSTNIYPCAEAVTEYFPGTRSLQKSPSVAVVTL